MICGRIDKLMESKKHPFWVMGMASIGSLTAIVLFASLGFYSRYWADDYCYSATVVEKGFWGALISYPDTLITSRYSAFMVTILSEALGRQVISLLSALGILLWLSGMTWILITLLREKGFMHPHLLGLLLAEMIVFFTILMTPNRFQSIYWRAAMVTYLGSLVIAIGLVCLYVKFIRDEGTKRNSFFSYLSFFLLSVIAGGFSETLVAVMLGGLGIFYAAIRLGSWNNTKNRLRHLHLLEAGILGFGVALMLLFFSPTNNFRRAVLAPSLDIFNLVSLSISFSWDFIIESFKGLPVPFLILGLSCGLIAYSCFPPGLKLPNSGKAIRSIILLIIFGYALVFFSFAPSVYGESAFPEGRSLIIGRYIIILTVAAVSFYVGLLISFWVERSELEKSNQRTVLSMLSVTSYLLAMLLLTVYPLKTGVEIIGSVPEYRLRAYQWDERDREIRTQADQGVRKIVVKGFNNLYDVYELSPEPDLWVNRCAARFYKVDMITALP
jgi:hypothetical protein